MGNFVGFRVLILNGKFKDKIGIMDSAGHITFTDCSDTIHNSKVQWRFYDFK